MIYCLKWEGRRPAQKCNCLIFVLHVFPDPHLFIVLNAEMGDISVASLRTSNFSSWIESWYEERGSTFYSREPTLWKGELFKGELTFCFRKESSWAMGLWPCGNAGPGESNVKILFLSYSSSKNFPYKTFFKAKTSSRLCVSIIELYTICLLTVYQPVK